MNEIVENQIDIHIFKLLELATSTDKVIEEYNAYQQIETRMLYGWKTNDVYVACIGIEMIERHHAEIKHIAVTPDSRKQKLGSRMLDYVVQELGLHRLTAETDCESVGFYRRCGFTVSSLGEKYPGVERFLCVWEEKILVHQTR
ncbi:GNAT family N-acetyltransferase [Psychrobacillus sp. BL-248-WT-3]|uniref:GNAT family N-acetyltransferase n=1 Tax=Psychrobacillus sp. BL-248-WT-3 TaxID=2725306 RepID=UPI00146B5443|nr:GNAT family N-acetyltransferase [Psychrobacillus sp. BL-248-WT-3]NME05464.1 GNAT family N-acetyltransferase [Psychrobacillus sp. BL-248-WT-3]